jgi:hypothetical protein
MPTSINNVYPVTTPPFVPEKFQGMIISLMGRQYRFCAFEPLAAVDLEAGVFVTGTTDALGNFNVQKPTSTAAKILGVTLLNFQRVLTWDASLGVFKYPAFSMVSLVEEGDIVMYSEVSVDVGDSVYFRHTVNGGLNRIGALANVAGTGLDLAPAGTKFLEKTTSPGLVRVSLPDII